ncbi:acyl-ACP--UDP-N-acetylglucosamine O-acyltransferase [Lacipirellula parvula]|uniref:O-acyltransferase n=1 Tax=Lacipirellula parvula TaxID=2650471 RepID=A0A5K7XFD6_9BACT|nr:acyl-ACP--UDP-N-acetylglucosamine O-acyltransferase [Lacipirellula parvula]BBO31699.1 O-acyltransferase [Lacipirellula parvula]
MIHPTAVVSPRAVVHSSVEIGPFSIIEADAVIGQGCKLAGRTTIKSHTILGRDVVVGEGAVLGGLPQHISPPENPGRVIVGERTVIRENVTIHRAMITDGETRIGSDCLMMVGSHAAHDVRVGNRVIITNNVLLGGHVQIGDRAVLGGAAAVHQHCRVGRLAMVGACAKIVQDVPPFVLTDGEMGMIVGLNRVGLRRSGMTREEVDSLKEAYRLIYRRGYLFDEMVATLAKEHPTGPATELSEFFTGGKRGFAQERRSPPKATIRIHAAADDLEDEDSAGELKRKAG